MTKAMRERIRLAADRVVGVLAAPLRAVIGVLAALAYDYELKIDRDE